MEKIVITIGGGTVEVIKPDNVEIEIRDYDIAKHGLPAERPDCKQDCDKEWYQEMIFPAKKDILLKFKCPKCGHTELEEVMTDCILTSVIGVIDGEGAVDYDDKRITTTDGEVHHYQCVACGFILSDNNDVDVNNNEELAEWLKENCKQD